MNEFQYRFLQAEASTYLSSAKGILRAALQADAVAFKRNVKPLIDDHPAYQGGVGHTFMGSFYLVAPWPVHNLAKAKVRVASVIAHVSCMNALICLFEGVGSQ